MNQFLREELAALLAESPLPVVPRSEPISIFKPNGWHMTDGLDARIYRAAQSIDGVTDILQPHLSEDMPKELRGAIFASCDLLSRIRDELFHVANMHVACEDEGA